ncbi:MAG: hypothetical protein H0W69_02015 [Gemmatimonadaceae bacterium]|nr:hypothetical protein [Gemmatimonadaceae bacterium]
MKILFKYTTISASFRCLAAALALFAVSACGGSDGGGITEPPPPPPPVTLTFALKQVNGQNLPASFQTAEGLLVIGSGTMTMRPDKTFTENIAYTLAPQGGTAAPDAAITAGTYVQTGADVIFTVSPIAPDPQYTFNGTIVGQTLTYNDAGFVAVYSR